MILPCELVNNRLENGNESEFMMSRIRYRSISTWKNLIARDLVLYIFDGFFFLIFIFCFMSWSASGYSWPKQIINLQRVFAAVSLAKKQLKMVNKPNTS